MQKDQVYKLLLFINLVFLHRRRMRRKEDEEEEGGS
jgi:hypothetical protein